MKIGSDIKDILVVGNSDYSGARIARKIIADGHKVRVSKLFIERRDILCERDLSFLGHANLLEIEENFQDQGNLKNIISGCNVVLYLAQIFHENEYKPDYEGFTSLVDKSKASGVERFIYASDNTRENASFLEYLKGLVADNFTIIIIEVSTHNMVSSSQKLKISVNVLTEEVSKEHKVTLYNGKQTKGIAIRVRPNTWYVPRVSHFLGFYINGLTDLCSHLCEQPLKQIQKSSWASLTTSKVFLRRFSIFNQLVKRLKNPFFTLGSIKRLLHYIRRLVDVSLMMFLLHIWPEQMYRFSTRKCLPPKKMRFSKRERQVIPFELIKSRTSDIPKMKEINIVLRGSSFDINKLSKLDGPTFLVSFWEPVETEKDVIYATGRAKAARWFGQRGYNAIFIEANSIRESGDILPMDGNYSKSWYEQFVEEGVSQRIALFIKIFSSPKPPLWAPTNSGIQGICALSWFAEKVNVYGWDYYLDSSPDLMSYWQLFSNLYHLKPDLLLTRTHLESTMINYYYAYYLSKMPKINIVGPLGELSKHEKLIGKIERALFNV